ncbi:hypothetical protein ACFVJ8_11190 [Streptomyces yangpuensis]|uniref:hypothetical protein n=1 Tax=Streptomyces yangpuensis TaxID=1648182 RepID=UPI003628C396
MLREVEQLADRAAHAAGDTGAIAQLGAAWGITKQAARLRWPGAVRKPNDTSGQAEPFEKGGFVWEVTEADGTSGLGEEPYANQTEAARHDGVFLARHAALVHPYAPACRARHRFLKTSTPATLAWTRPATPVVAVDLPGWFPLVDCESAEPEGAM